MLPSYITISGIIILFYASCSCKRKWQFDLISTYWNSTDESYLKLDWHLERISRGEYGISGEWIWQFPNVSNVMVQAQVYSSYSGDDREFVKTPIEIPKMKFTDGLKRYYNNFFYENLKHCSNLDEFVDEKQLTWTTAHYQFNRCIPTCNRFPDIMLDGFYKIVCKVSDDNAVATLSITAKLFNKYD